MTAPQRDWSATEPQRGYEIERRQRALAQLDVDAATEATLYTCPKGRMAIGRVYVTEVGGAAATFRIRLADAADNVKQWLAYDYSIAANDTNYTEELWLTADDRIDVYASTTNLSFTFNGYTIPKDTT